VRKIRRVAIPVHMPDKSGLRMIKLWLPVLVCMGIIFYASSLPGSDIPPLFPFQDIAFHILIYLILALFFSHALKNTYTDIALSKVILLTIIFGIVYGITDELHQAFVPDRTASGLDVIIDGIGSFIRSIVYRWPK
jgi:VanZ family protein